VFLVTVVRASNSEKPVQGLRRQWSESSPLSLPPLLDVLTLPCAKPPLDLIPVFLVAVVRTPKTEKFV